MDVRGAGATLALQRASSNAVAGTHEGGGDVQGAPHPALGGRVCGSRTRHLPLLSEGAPSCASSRDPSQARRPQSPQSQGPRPHRPGSLHTLSSEATRFWFSTSLHRKVTVRHCTSPGGSRLCGPARHRLCSRPWDGCVTALEILPRHPSCGQMCQALRWPGLRAAHVVFHITHDRFWHNNHDITAIQQKPILLHLIIIQK